jgi:hypothetical protein
METVDAPCSFELSQSLKNLVLRCARGLRGLRFVHLLTRRRRPCTEVLNTGLCVLASRVSNAVRKGCMVRKAHLQSTRGALCVPPQSCLVSFQFAQLRHLFSRLISQ